MKNKIDKVVGLVNEGSTTNIINSEKSVINRVKQLANNSLVSISGKTLTMPILNIVAIVTKIVNKEGINKVFLKYNDKDIGWYILNKEGTSIMTKNYKGEKCFVIDYFKHENGEMFFLKDKNLNEIGWVTEDK